MAILVNKKGDIAAFENWTPGSASQPQAAAQPAQQTQQASSHSESENIKGVHRNNISSIGVVLF